MRIVPAGGAVWAVVPMKALAEAKQRLAPLHSPAMRRALTLAMLEDVLAAVSKVPGLDGVIVATLDPDIAVFARQRAARVVDEDAGSGLNAAVTAAGRRLASEGGRAMLVLPGDVPGVRPEEVAAILAGHRDGADAVIVPAHDGLGTNALLIAPPDAIAFAYGADSFAAHLAAARRAGLSPCVLRLPGIGLDCDTPEDLARFARLPGGGATRRMLAAGFNGRAPDSRSTDR